VISFPVVVGNEEKYQEIAYYESKGKGETVVMVHGNSSSSWSYFHQLCGSLGKKYHLIAVDLPGHGRSSNAFTVGTTYNLPGYASFLVQFVDALGLHDAIFVGWSLGGHVLLEASSELPSASGFMIFGTPPIDYNPEPPIPPFLDHLANFLGILSEWTNENLEIYVSSFFKPNTNYIPDFFFKDGRRTDGVARSTLPFSPFKDEVVIVGDPTIPPLAIFHGEQDQLINLDYIENLSIPNLWRGKVHVIKNAGHAPHWEKPAQFNRLLSKFIKDVSN
jgi:pimeloyl-ACP methyl ester carboxylesterase